MCLCVWQGKGDSCRLTAATEAGRYFKLDDGNLPPRSLSRSLIALRLPRQSAPQNVFAGWPRSFSGMRTIVQGYKHEVGSRREADHRDFPYDVIVIVRSDSRLALVTVAAHSSALQSSHAYQ